ncbi:hypothetical protein FRZ06_21180 [Anoxybacterium hadale]|uniref:Uncharacterized protein n=1 Tax=Anoxybacterium hadale TaxID=3408580 RepID=A0ACD1AGM2_9FIRM|nr:hypothetical protein FRZ06_21180 [Clostridiales bacterium]
MKSITGNLFSNEELQEIRSKFKYVDRDFEGTKSNTAVLCCMAASNISGHIYDIKKYLRELEKSEHNRLLGKAADCWEVGSPSPAHYAAITEVVNYVSDLGSKIANGESSRRRLFELGMKRSADHERVLLNIMLEGTENVAGLRQMKGLTVKMDGQDLNTRDLILGIEFDNMSCDFTAPCSPRSWGGVGVYCNGTGTVETLNGTILGTYEE